MDKRHFERFYTSYFKRIYKFVYFRVGGNRALAQDLTQDVFLKTFQAFDRYDPLVSQVSWIYTIARNHLANAYAKNRPQVDLDEVEGTLQVSVDLRECFANQHDERILCETLRRLPVEDAELVRMKYLEGWSFDDLQQIMGKTSGALRVQASTTLKKLKGLMKDPYASPDEPTI